MPSTSSSRSLSALRWPPSCSAPTCPGSEGVAALGLLAGLQYLIAWASARWPQARGSSRRSRPCCWSMTASTKTRYGATGSPRPSCTGPCGYKAPETSPRWRRWRWRPTASWTSSAIRWSCPRSARRRRPWQSAPVPYRLHRHGPRVRRRHRTLGDEEPAQQHPSRAADGQARSGVTSPCGGPTRPRRGWLRRALPATV